MENDMRTGKVQFSNGTEGMDAYVVMNYKKITKNLCRSQQVTLTGGNTLVRWNRLARNKTWDPMSIHQSKSYVIGLDLQRLKLTALLSSHYKQCN